MGGGGLLGVVFFRVRFLTKNCSPLDLGSGEVTGVKATPPGPGLSVEFELDEFVLSL